MRAILLSGLAILLAAGVCQARHDSQPVLTRQAVLPGESEDDSPRSTVTLRADTVWYGDYEIVDGTYYARSSTNKADVLWTFDRGNGPFGDPDRLENGGGWRAVDPRKVSESYFRVIDGTLDLGNGVAAPILSGEHSLWVGISGPQADSLCYDCGAGYGDSWLQCVTSESLPYNGEGDVSVSFLYFNDSEDCYDGTQVYLRREDETRLLLNPYDPPYECENNIGWDDGSFTGTLGSPEFPETYTRMITAGEIGGAQNIRIEFEFTSDGGWSDEDCQYATINGPFAVDSIVIEGGGIDAFYDFEDGLQGWTPSVPTGLEQIVGITDIDCYTYYDGCVCALDANILKFHRGLCDDGDFWDEDQVRVDSPICVIDSSGTNDFFLEFDTYSSPLRGY